jgi:hypothetical protein
MLDGTRFGWQVGLQLARAYAGPNVYTAQQLREIAALVYENLERAGNAHVWPRDGFVSSFVQGFLYWQEQMVAA